MSSTMSKPALATTYEAPTTRACNRPQAESSYPGHAECEPNPLPEVALSNAPEAVYQFPDNVKAYVDGLPTEGPVPDPGFPSPSSKSTEHAHESRGGAYFFTDHIPSWFDRQPFWARVIFILVVVLSAGTVLCWSFLLHQTGWFGIQNTWARVIIVVLSIGLFAATLTLPIMLTVTPGSGTSSSGTHNTPEPTTTSLTSSTSTLSATPTPSLVPGLCDKSNFTDQIDFVGSTRGGWKWQYTTASDAFDCCRQCEADPVGCTGWFFDGRIKGGIPSCSYIYGSTGPSPDAWCPLGKPNIVFNYVSGLTENHGGLGPCGGRIEAGAYRS